MQTTKLGLHLRQRQAEVRRSSLSSASVDGALSQAARLRGCRNLSNRMLVYESEASPRNSPPYVQYGRNVRPLAETEKHSSVCGAACWGCSIVPRLVSTSNIFPTLRKRCKNTKKPGTRVVYKCFIIFALFVKVFFAFCVTSQISRLSDFLVKRQMPSIHYARRTVKKVQKYGNE